MSGRLAGTAVVDENGNPRVVYHGTSRQFEELDADAQAEALFGRAFYFTEDPDVARNYAQMRHVPPFEVFDSDEQLKAFCQEHPDWEVVDVDRPGAKLVVQFRNDEHRPAVIHANLAITRPLDLDAAPETEVLQSVRERLNGAPSGDPATAGDLFNEIAAAFAADGADEDEARGRARELIGELGYDGLTQVDERHGNDDRVWVAFDAVQVVELERELL